MALETLTELPSNNYEWFTCYVCQVKFPKRKAKSLSKRLHRGCKAARSKNCSPKCCKTWRQMKEVDRQATLAKRKKDGLKI